MRTVADSDIFGGHKTSSSNPYAYHPVIFMFGRDFCSYGIVEMMTAESDQ